MIVHKLILSQKKNFHLQFKTQQNVIFFFLIKFLDIKENVI